MAVECRACGEDRARGFFDLGAMPLAGGFLRGPEQIPDERAYPLAVSVCDECSLVQISDPVDPDILFQDYSFKTGTIPGLVAHFDAYAQWLKDRGASAVVEFGANDGTLVAALEQRGIKAVGVDLSANITALGREQGRDLITGAFGPAILPELREHVAQADIVTGSNVFAHNEHPELIIRAADEILTPDGLLCIEAMYAGDLLEQLQWDTLYHEHLTFYSLATLGRLLSRHGFEVVEAERIPMHGGSLRVAAARVGTRERAASVDALAAEERDRELNDPATWDRFATDAFHRIEVFGDTVRRLAESAEIWAYGAAGKATMWVNACKMDYLKAVVDASPLRSGKLMPGTHTPIVTPEEFRAAAPDYVFASAWNYLDAIRRNEPAYTGYWIVPLPEMRVH
jgi:SAM-dependent methyltransferase